MVFFAFLLNPVNQTVANLEIQQLLHYNWLKQAPFIYVQTIYPSTLQNQYNKPCFSRSSEKDSLFMNQLNHQPLAHELQKRLDPAFSHTNL